MPRSAAATRLVGWSRGAAPDDLARDLGVADRRADPGRPPAGVPAARRARPRPAGPARDAVRDRARHLRGRAERRPRGRRRADAGLHRVPAPHPGPVVRRHPPPPRGRRTPSTRCSPTAGTAARSAWAGPTTSGGARPRSWPSSRSSTRTARSPSSAPTRRGSGRRATSRVADLIDGQHEDRRLVGQSTWEPVRVVDHGFDTLTTSPAPPVRAVEELRPGVGHRAAPRCPRRRPGPEHQRTGPARRPRPRRAPSSCSPTPSRSAPTAT